jgi:hypothetical protein
MKASRTALVVIATVAGALVVAVAVFGLGRLHEFARGRGIFDGAVAVPARVLGQDFALPVQASRCVNCHATTATGSAAPPAIGGEAAARSARGLDPASTLGPALTPAHLREPRPRRGGPPSRYDAASLCRLLRTGIDPAHVLITPAMPRFDVSDADCLALWRFLG